MNRGARRELIFRDWKDRLLFQDCLEESILRTRFELHAFCLMPNHFHLLLRSQQGNVSAAIKHLCASFTQRLNMRHKWDGPVFRGRFRSQLVERNEHLLCLVPYIHLNPVEAGIVTSPEHALWSSCAPYYGLRPAPEWLHTEEVLSWFNGASGLRQATDDHRTGIVSWPADMELETGVFRSVPCIPAPSPEPQSRTEGGGQARTSLLASISAVTQIPVAELTHPGRRPTAVEARRFSVWLLARRSALTYSEIAALLGTSPNNIAVLVNRTEKGPLSPLMQLWLAQLRDGGVVV
jgi:REP element-mobilizing transposase RayT